MPFTCLSLSVSARLSLPFTQEVHSSYCVRHQLYVVLSSLYPPWFFIPVAVSIASLPRCLCSACLHMILISQPAQRQVSVCQPSFAYLKPVSNLFWHSSQILSKYFELSSKYGSNRMTELRTRHTCSFSLLYLC